MRMFLNIILAVFFVVPLIACGVKGKLKTPDQIEKEAAKDSQGEAVK